MRYTPTTEDLQSIEQWFAEYDALAAKGEVDRLADMAIFPMNLATDVPGGYGAVRQWTREEYLETMRQAMGEGAAGLKPKRTPHFLSPNLVVVETVDEEHGMHYADLLVRTADGWGFQTMVQGGWGHGWPPAKLG
ncbi:nuclear transport factor 2 family protein [Thermoactinospora rubra]|uniref:nuclear transport factor 2 family protein n=1 Tax=Thermoactinospora rubra TaxID=1088767 RepID=UPI00117F6946|nr:nuclear transport factor 2 family protein [Thermoactinospora rubra]